MARHPTARRVHHSGAADPDDAFIAQLLELTAWAKAHARLLTIAAVALVLGTVVGLYYRNHQAQLHMMAETQLAGVRQTVASGNGALAIKDLEEFLARFDGTRAADEARVLLAQSYLAEGRPQQALTAAEPLARSLGTGMGTTAAMLQAAAYEAAGQPDRAEALYLRIAEEARFDYERQDALDAAARIRMEAGDAAGAAELYERLAQLTPDGSPQRGIVELRLAEARARSRSR